MEQATACPGCSAAQPAGARFCFSCGATVAPPSCASCGARLIAGARFCSECGSAQGAARESAQDGAGATPRPPSSPGQPVSARRVTSVLFGDLVGFTSLSESRDQEDVRELLSQYFEDCRRIIERYGGTVEKFIGDAVMAVWGVPTAHEDDAERAVRAGLELVNAIAAMGGDLGVVDLQMRAGIVTGEVAVTLGAAQQGMVAGDAVNTAARVQSAAAPGQVWVDETTRLLTSSAITYVDVGSHAMKGKVDPVPLWAVRAVVAAVGGAQRADGLEAPHVGRDRELRLVKELFHRVEESRRPALLVISGEPGVGKSRLGWEFEKYIDGLHTVTRWHSGRCLSYGEGVAYYALAEAFRGRLQSLQDDDVDDPAVLLAGGLDRFVPDPDERAWLEPRIGALLGLGAVGTYPRDDLFSAWTTFLHRVSEDRHPVALVVDDAQYADDGLVSFLEHLLSAASFPCFVALLARPGLLEEHPGLATNRRATIVHLDALAPRDIGLLLDGLVAGLPPTVRDSLVVRAEGMPLYAVETVRSLIDRDLVIPRGGQYVLADPDALDLDQVGAPASLQALISARLDSLDPGQRTLVDRASVLGTVFSREQIADLSGDLADLDGLLAGLIRQQILSRAASRLSADFGQYQFVQTAVRQVAYATLSRRDRRALHLQVARHVEVLDDAAGEFAPIIAQHYLDAMAAMPDEPDAAELEQHAIVHLERSASRARSLGAMRESAGHLTTALEHAHDPGTRARLESSATAALLDAGDFDGAVAAGRRATAAHDELGDPVAAGLTAAWSAQALGLMGDPQGAREMAAPRWEQLQDEPGADVALLELGRALSAAYPANSIERHRVLDRRIQIAEKSGSALHLSDSLTGLSVSYANLGAAQTSRILMEAAADIARSNHLPTALARCLVNLTADANLEDLRQALETGREAVAVAARTGIAVWRSYAEANLCIGLAAAGGWAELEESAARSTLTDIITNRTVTAGLLGMVRLARGQDAPVPWTQDEAPQSENREDEAWARLAEAMQRWSGGDLRGALEEAAGAVEAIHSVSGLSDDFSHLWPAAVELAMLAHDEPARDRLLLLVDDGRSRAWIPRSLVAHRARFAGLIALDEDAVEAEAQLRLAIETFRAWGAEPYVARTEGELGGLLVSQGRSEEAAPYLERARETLTRIGAHGWLGGLVRVPA